MTSATRITDYLGEGLHSARPTSPSIPTGGLVFYYETDTTSLFVYDISTTSWLAVGGGGGGGFPSSPVQGDIVYYNGTAWVSLAPGTAGDFLTTGGSGANPSWTAGGGGGGGGGGFPNFSPPLASLFPTAFSGNSHTNTATDTTYGLSFNVNSTNSFSDSIEGIFKSKPTGSTYTVDAVIRPNFTSQIDLEFGIMLLESSTGKAVSTGLIGQGNNNSSSVYQPFFAGWSNATTVINTTIISPMAQNDCFFRISFDGTNYNALVSNDQHNWCGLGGWFSFNSSIPFTTGPDKVGIFINPHMGNSGGLSNISMVVPYYKENA